MCGIIGYKGMNNATERILNCLKRLEYRGYDSWGIAVQSDKIHVIKKAGKKVLIKQGIPFVPAFLITLIIMALFFLTSQPLLRIFSFLF